MYLIRTLRFAVVADHHFDGGERAERGEELAQLLVVHRRRQVLHETVGERRLVHVSLPLAPRDERPDKPARDPSSLISIVHSIFHIHLCSLDKRLNSRVTLTH